MSPKYSICITHYNEIERVDRSLRGILGQIDDQYEVVIVDNFSTDGSYQVLKQYADEGRVRLYQVKCSRGKGRQVAFERSVGEYIVAGMDLDDFFVPTLDKLLSLFHSDHEDKLVRVKRSPVEGKEYFSGITVARRETIEAIGGWRDLNWYEDSDIWKRARMASVLVELSFPIVMRNSPIHEKKGMWSKAKHRYLTYRECLRADLKGEVDLKIRPGTFPLYLAAWVGSKLKPLPETKVDLAKS